MDKIKQVDMTTDGQLFIKLDVTGKSQTRNVGIYLSEKYDAISKDDFIKLVEHIVIRAITKEVL